MKQIYLLLVMTFTVSWHAQAGIIDRIAKAYEKQDFGKVLELIDKAIEKQGINPGARYYQSLLYLNNAFERHNIDSSYYYINSALDDFQIASGEILEELKQDGILLTDLTEQKQRINEAAYQRAIRFMDVASFNSFIDFFDAPGLIARATYKRDSLAFNSATETDTWQAYQNFIQQYENSQFHSEAKTRYQILLFKDYTNDNQLSGYEQFLADHPTSPFRKEAEDVVFTRRVQKNQWLDYLHFLKDYPTSSLSKKAGDILYYQAKRWYPERMATVFTYHPNADSIKEIQKLEHNSLIPFLEGSLFGFFTRQGKTILSPKYEAIDDDYRCGVDQEWLLVANENETATINRLGQTILSGTDAIKPVGSAAYLVTRDGITHLHYASGYQISNLEINDAKELTNGLIAFRHQYSWGIVHPGGEQLLAPIYEEIDEIGPYLILSREGSFAVTNFDEIRNSKPDAFLYDDYELVQDTLLQVYSGDLEALIGSNLKMIVALDDQRIYHEDDFWYIKSKDGYRQLSISRRELGELVFKDLSVNRRWFAFKNEDKWMLVSRNQESLEARKNLDSVNLLHESFVLIQKGDTSQLIFTNGTQKDLRANNEIRLISDNSNNAFLNVREDETLYVYDANGKQLFDKSFDEVAILIDSVFRVRQGKQTGAYDARGKELVPIEYDLIDEKSDLLFLLKGQHIGCLDLKTGVMIPANYEARIERLTGNYLVKKEGKFGLVDNENSLVIPNESDEIKDWNDTSLWVQSNDIWQLINLKNDILMEGVLSLRPWLTIDGEQLSVARTKDGFGILSNLNGQVLPFQYNDILNVGSETSPIFFAEQFLDLASYYVITYFNLSGKVLRSFALRPKEYDRIFCDQ